MKIVRILLLVLIPFVFINAQGMHRQADPAALEKIEQLENAKLIKLLDLKEEDAIRFFSRRKEYQQHMRGFLQQRREIIDNTHELLREDEKGNQKKLKDKIDEIFELESQIFREKRGYYKSLQDIISPKQILQLMSFEERFRREVREKLINRQNKKDGE